MAMFLAATLAFRKTFPAEDPEEDQGEKRSFKPELLWWGLAGLLGGLAVMFRPDSGLFLAAVGITLVGSSAFRRILTPHNGRLKAELRTLAAAAIFSLAFMLVLLPWTIRNARTFHLFQPLAPSHGEMPGEFVPRGYQL